MMRGFKRKRCEMVATGSTFLLFSIATTSVAGFQTSIGPNLSLPHHSLGKFYNPHSVLTTSRLWPQQQQDCCHQFQSSSVVHRNGASRQWMSAAADVASSAASKTVQSAASAASNNGIAVSLDQPLFADGLFTAASSSSTRASMRNAVQKFVTKLLENKVAKAAIATFCIALVLSLSLRLFLGPSILSDYFRKLSKLARGRWERMTERWTLAPKGEPMPFEEENEGWSVCTLKSRKRLGKTQFMQFDFDLPRSEFTIPLDLGQQISLCCLDNEGNVARGSFFPFYTTSNPRPGSFSILVPNVDSELLFRIGLDNANFVRVIKHELKVGDEVALTPGGHRLSYKGQYLPVTDMVYVAYGTGIVPVLDQIRAVLPSGASSVSSVTVVWINASTEDFDVLADVLEKEYFKYSDKLAVSCIVVSNVEEMDFASNDDVNIAIPDFRQGTMAVLGGPTEILEKASFYLEDRGYPLDTICIL